MFTVRKCSAFLHPTFVHRHHQFKMCASTKANSVPIPWRQMNFPDRCMRLSLTLPTGQSFRWIETGEHPFSPAHSGNTREWAGVVGNQLYLVRQTEPEPPDGVPDPVWYVVAGRETLSEEETEHDHIIRDYFHERIDLSSAVVSFCDADKAYNHLFPHLRGVRLLRQSPTESLFAYICSACNHIKRITLLVRYLASRYGDPIREYCGEEFYSFPTCEKLAEQATEEELRDAGFGYRAKSIVETAQQLTKLAKKESLSCEQLLLSWRDLDREQVAKHLTQFTGVGRKVAGCVALTSLDKYDEIPCDTHVWQIAQRYMPELHQKSLTDRIYTRIGDFFRDKFGEYAGFAHNVLFVAELNDYKHLIPDKSAMEACWSSLKEADSLPDDLENDAHDYKKTKATNDKGSKSKSPKIAKKSKQESKKATNPLRRSTRKTNRTQ